MAALGGGAIGELLRPEYAWEATCAPGRLASLSHYSQAANHVTLAVLAVSASAAMQQTLPGWPVCAGAELQTKHVPDWPALQSSSRMGPGAPLQWHRLANLAYVCSATLHQHRQVNPAHVCCMAALAETGRPRLPGVTCLLLDCNGWDGPICQGRKFPPMHTLISEVPKQPQPAVLAPCSEAVR